MKSILLSIRPEWVAKILNGEKTIEIRRKFPADYVGWVYIYCTKDKKTKLSSNSLQYYVADNKDYKKYMGNWNGKVLARFWCDKVEEIEAMYDELYRCYDFGIFENTLLRNSYLEEWELGEYLKITNNNDYEVVGYAIHISKLEVFDKPRELSEFKKRNELDFWQWNSGLELYSPLTKAPQNYCYIESEE